MMMRTIDIEQGSDQWHVERWGSVGGTRLQSAIGAKYSKAKKKWTLGDKGVQKTLMLEMVSECQSEVEIDDYCSEAMERGNELEPISVGVAEKRMNVKLRTCGMFQSVEMPRIKYSPDASCVGRSGIVRGGYETKSKAGKKHIEYRIDNCVPSEHLWQCLTPMIISDSVKWWAFGHYDDRNHVDPLFLTLAIRNDYEELIQEARELLKNFFIDLEDMVQELGGHYNG